MLNRMVYTTLFAMVAAMFGMLLYWQVDIIHRGGPIMVPIIMCSMFALAITVERLYFFTSLRTDATKFFTQLSSLVRKRQWREAEAFCKATEGPVSRVALAGLRAHEKTVEEIESVMGEAAHEELPLVERHQWLSPLAQVSTLLGLLGTVAGMVAAFQIIQSKATSTNPVSPADLAGGIWQALITTVAGLSVAIPTILAYNYLAGRVQEIQYQMERVSIIIANWRRTESS